MQWGSRNLSRIMFGDHSFFGLKEINYSLPVTFEFTDKPELYLSSQEAKDLLSVNYQGYQNGQHSLMNISNVQYILENINETQMVAFRLQVSEAKAEQLSRWLTTIENSLKTIEEHYQMPYFRGRHGLSSQLFKRRFDKVPPVAERLHSHQRDCSSLETASFRPPRGDAVRGNLPQTLRTENLR